MNFEKKLAFHTQCIWYCIFVYGALDQA